MDSASWLSAFEGNRREPELVRGVCGANLDAELRALVLRSLQSFQVGEASGGRIAQEIMTSRDPALDPELRQAVRLYVREEGRHAAELAAVIRALGGELLSEHWTNRLFRRCRRLLGLRTKLITMAVAEVIGIVFYEHIARGVDCPEVNGAMLRIARDERRHLDFQSALFAQVLRTTPGVLRRSYAAWLRLQLSLILGLAIATVWIEHQRLFRLLGRDFSGFVGACLAELRGPSRLGRLAAAAGLDACAGRVD